MSHCNALCGPCAAAMVLLVHSWAIAETKLPSARQLIEEALALCPEATEDNSLPRIEIAVAFGYLGDFTKARAILDAHENNVFVYSGYMRLDEVEIDRTGQEPPLRPSPNDLPP